VAGSSLLESIPLIDHHCHGVTFAELGAAQFDELASESSAPGTAVPRSIKLVGLSWARPR